jgi:DNA polymerase II
MTTRAWLFDLYPWRSRMVLWFLTADGRRLRLTDTFTYRLYAQGPEAKLRRLAGQLRSRHWVQHAYFEDKIDFATGLTRPALCLEVTAYECRPRLLAYLGALEEDLSFYNCDLDISSYYLYCRRLFPCCWYDLELVGDRLAAATALEAQFQEDITLPSLAALELTLTRDHLIPLGSGNGLALTWEGRTMELEAADVPGLLAALSRVLHQQDPDLLISDWGDEYILPVLWHWSRQHRRPLPLDREPAPPPRQLRPQGRSYFSYGRIVYQGPSVPFYGRWHVDRRNSFFLRETGLAGLVQLARLGQVPLQQVARTSPGTLITSMQLARAVADNILIPWRKGEPERFKTAAELLVADKGGLVFQPPVGFHPQVAEIDFASMYPTIMAIHNISPETINCPCCSEPRVPEDNYVLCQQRLGLVPRTLQPILDLRANLKRRAKAAVDPEAAADFKARQNALKWILVTCFGYLGYKNARFGRIEAHEAVTAFGRDKLLTAKEICEAAAYEVLHGLTDCLWIRQTGEMVLGRGRGQGARLPGPPPQALTETDLLDLCQRITAATGVTMALEGIYRWMVFLPSQQQEGRPVPNRYFGVFQDGTLKYRGLMCRRRDTPRLVRRAQEALLATLARAGDWAEGRALWPELQEVAVEYRLRLEQGLVQPEDLVITKVLSRPLDQFRVQTHTALAARQLQTAGIRPAPGEKLRYIVRDRQGPPETRVLAAPFFASLDRYDTAYYLELLAKAVDEVLWPWQSTGMPPA